MVKKSLSGSKKGSGQKKAKKKHELVEDDGMPRGVLIPPELDEDIDDDLAFDSDDERMYGGFFSSGSGGGGGKKTATKKGGIPKEEDLYNYHEDGQSSGDDDDEYMDLDDMLDVSLGKEEKLKSKKSKSKKSTVESENGGKVTKKKRSGKDDVLRLVNETLYPDKEHSASYTSTIKKLVKSDGGKKSAMTRIEKALETPHNLISVDVDEKTKEAVTRKKVREVTEENLRKYKPVLRDMNTTKHLQLPLPMPESNPIPSSIGSIVSSSISNSKGLEANDEGSNIPTTANRKAATQLATKMQSLLSTAGLSSRDDEEGSGGKDSLAALAKSRKGSEAPTIQYMAKLKAMLASENSRRRRLNKIKSKTYRRILRKEIERDKEKREKALALLNPELARKKLADKLAKARAEERITQKHKNTSAWVKHAKRVAHFDTQAKDAVNEQLVLHQQLMQKMNDEAGEDNYRRYVGDDEEDNQSEEEDRLVDDLVGSSSPDIGKKVASQLWQDIEKNSGNPALAKARAELRDMKFMKAAKEREMKEYEEELTHLNEEVQAHLKGEEGLQDERKPQTRVGKTTFQKSNDTLETIVLRGDVDASPSPTTSAHGAETSAEDTEVSGAADTSEFAGARPKAKAASSRITVLPSIAGVKRGAEQRKEEETEETEKEVLSDQQAYLVSRAFAADDLDEEFKREKESQVELVMRPEDRNRNLPGWGEWGGEDSRLNKRHQEKLRHATMQKNIEKTFLQKSRADAALDHVIINHDGVELVPDRMTLHMVPRPFSNPQEFARSMRQPVGPEWSSPLSFVEGVQPRVEVRQGHAITPLDLDLRQKKAKTKRRKEDTPRNIMFSSDE